MISQQPSDRKYDPYMPENPNLLCLASGRQKRKLSAAFLFTSFYWTDSFSWLGKKVPHHEVVIDL